MPLGACPALPSSAVLLHAVLQSLTLRNARECVFIRNIDSILICSVSPLFFLDPADLAVRAEDRAFLLGTDVLVLVDIYPPGKSGYAFFFIINL